MTRCTQIMGSDGETYMSIQMAGNLTPSQETIDQCKRAVEEIIKKAKAQLATPNKNGA